MSSGDQQITQTKPWHGRNETSADKCVPQTTPRERGQRSRGRARERARTMRSFCRLVGPPLSPVNSNWSLDRSDSTIPGGIVSTHARRSPFQLARVVTYARIRLSLLGSFGRQGLAQHLARLVRKYNRHCLRVKCRVPLRLPYLERDSHRAVRKRIERCARPITMAILELSSRRFPGSHVSPPCSRENPAPLSYPIYPTDTTIPWGVSRPLPLALPYERRAIVCRWQDASIWGPRLSVPLRREVRGTVV